MIGGNLESNPIFQKILSIGFEFETSDLVKLSLNEDNVLVNTDTVPRTIAHQLKIGKDIKVDENYYNIDDILEYFDVPIHQEGKTKDKYNVVMNVGTDINDDILFMDKLRVLCKNIKHYKNNLYMFETNTTNQKHKFYDIHFSETLKTNFKNKLPRIRRR